MSTAHSISMRLGAAAAVLGCLALCLNARADTAVTADDADVNLGDPSANSGSSPTLQVRSAIGTSPERRSFVRFDLLALPPGTPIEQATLRIWVSAVTAAGVVEAHVVTTPWVEETVTAANAPSLAPAFGALSLNGSAVGGWATLDVTEQVQAWLDGAPNYGVALLASAADDVAAIFTSKESPRGLELEIVPIGPPGVSVAALSLPAGDPACPHGGSAFHSLDLAGEPILTYACNGTPAIGLDQCTLRANTSTLNSEEIEVSCAAGERIMGGGCSHGSPLHLRASYPVSSTTWRCNWTSPSTDSKSAHGICCTVGS